jgi:predicted dehydrogenase
MALEALEAGKHVFVEKPLALTEKELDGLLGFYENRQGEGPILFAGFNRRFSPFIHRIHEIIRDRSHPMIMNYRMNAGHLPLDHWVHSREGGGRNRGEACHIYDLFTCLTDSRVVEVQTGAISPVAGHYRSADNFTTTMTFEDGSLGTLTYTALGSTEYPKEHLEVYVDGKVLVLEDYRRLEVHGARTEGLSRRFQDKGHEETLRVFARNLQEGGAWPIPLWQQAQATRIAFKVEEQLCAHQPA